MFRCSVENNFGFFWLFRFFHSVEMISNVTIYCTFRIASIYDENEYKRKKTSNRCVFVSCRMHTNYNVWLFILVRVDRLCYVSRAASTKRGNNICFIYISMYVDNKVDISNGTVSRLSVPELEQWSKRKTKIKKKVNGKRIKKCMERNDDGKEHRAGAHYL